MKSVIVSNVWRLGFVAVVLLILSSLIPQRAQTMIPSHDHVWTVGISKPAGMYAMWMELFTPDCDENSADVFVRNDKSGIRTNIRHIYSGAPFDGKLDYLTAIWSTTTQRFVIISHRVPRVTCDFYTYDVSYSPSPVKKVPIGLWTKEAVLASSLPPERKHELVQELEISYSVH